MYKRQLSFCVLALTMDSLIVPLLFLFSIGVSIVYNMGSNAFLGDVSYVTQDVYKRQVRYRSYYLYWMENGNGRCYMPCCTGRPTRF